MSLVGSNHPRRDQNVLGDIKPSQKGSNVLGGIKPSQKGSNAPKETNCLAVGAQMCDGEVAQAWPCCQGLTGVSVLSRVPDGYGDTQAWMWEEERKKYFLAF